MTCTFIRQKLFHINHRCFIHINHYLKSVSKMALLHRFHCIASLLKTLTADAVTMVTATAPYVLKPKKPSITIRQNNLQFHADDNSELLLYCISRVHRRKDSQPLPYFQHWCNIDPHHISRVDKIELKIIVSKL